MKDSMSILTTGTGLGDFESILLRFWVWVDCMKVTT